MSEKLASISVDLDEVPRYAAIHDLAAPEDTAAHAVYDRCVPRLVDLFRGESIRATFFAIGEDLERARNREMVAALSRGGHEIANHSYHHHYDLTRRSAEEIRQEVEHAAAIIEDVCGTRPVGFRAPGYTVSNTLFDVLETLAVDYDSSVFPCPTYYAAKLSALGLMAIRGRRSQSIVDGLSVLRAPRQPYHVGRPYWRRDGGLLELPIGVTRWSLPYIGTSLVMWGARAAKQLTKQMLGYDFVNLELHGFDVADAADDGLQELKPHRPDLKRTATEKLGALRAAIELLRGAGYELVPLQEAARRLRAKPSP